MTLKSSLDNLQERELRYKVVYVPLRMLVSLCFINRLENKDFMDVSVMDGIPEGTEIISMNCTSSPFCVQILLWNKDWPIADITQDLPRLDVYSKIVKLKRLPDDGNYECYEVPTQDPK